MVALEGVVPFDRPTDDILDDRRAGLRERQPHDRGPPLGRERPSSDAGRLRQRPL